MEKAEHSLLQEIKIRKMNEHEFDAEEIIDLA